MRFLIAVVLVLNCGLCCGEDIPDGNIKGRVVSNEQALTAEQAAELVADFEGDPVSYTHLTLPTIYSV